LIPPFSFTFFGIVLFSLELFLENQIFYKLGQPISFPYLSKDETDKTIWSLYFQGENIHSAGDECLLCGTPLITLA
jgi:hypothetical protein